MKVRLLACSALFWGLTTTVLPLVAKAVPLASPIEMAQADGRLTAENVQAVVDQLQLARNNQDVAGTLELIAPFAVTVVTVKNGDGSASTTSRIAGVDAHRQMLEQSFGQVQSRDSLENYVTIRIVDDGLGIAEIYQMETVETLAGEAWIAASQTVLYFGRVDGQVRVTSATVDGWMAARPAPD
ncbi:hypothetical protein [Halomicronema sp. CCY15110]|uniref:hypothetical protein n=1 Tax=Halomicronema sp. CCY15110 TaxID=2767773 RepID=UPI00194FC1F7|nr:hypothetical protein [Halomicronema sp. CCY15110]